MFKPFKPPFVRDVSSGTHKLIEDEKISESPPRPAKKNCQIEADPKTTPIKCVLSGINALEYTLAPSTKVKNLDSHSGSNEGYFLVLWRKFTTKKIKTWDGDGVLSLQGGYARLQDLSGKEMGRAMFKDPLLPGSTLSVGGKDVEIDSIITKDEFMAGRPFIQSSVKRKPASTASVSPASKRHCATLSLTKECPKQEDHAKAEIPANRFYARKSVASNAKFKTPILPKSAISRVVASKPSSRHDPLLPGAVILKRPTDGPKGKQVVDVVIDPLLSRHLREHQKEGVKFLYECVMGMRKFNGNGAILADEMGLGKSLTTIALIWTLLKQNPYQNSTKVIEKALIVCPVTLIGNWKKEFMKWLGNERIGIFTDGPKKKLTDFTHGKSYSVMIIGYEKLRSVQDDLKKGLGIDIVVADEGHRLKTAQNKSAQAIRSLSTSMKIILSGTPIQNDLSEFFEMVDFVNPGLLGTYKTFSKEFEIPIMKSRQPEASQNDIDIGTARQEELSSLTKMFILRRTSEILAKYLPPRTEYVLFCKPTRVQVEVYQHVLVSPFFGNILGSSEASLQLITLLKKVCNAPSLISNKKQSKNNEVTASSSVAELLDMIPTELLHSKPIKESSKLRVLDQLLIKLSQNTSEKIVIVSNYTSTLDLLGQHLASLGLRFLRLDGRTPASKRQDLVDTFNKTSSSKNFAFLLSAKSGGAGLNLIGASRLVLFDVDWNPATDLQAMARIHRDGQKKPVKIYRLLLGGGIDEKIYQRQITKMGLADSVVDGKKTEASFSTKELRDLFRLDINPGCQTHDLLGCGCKGYGTDPLLSSDIDPAHEDDNASLKSVEESDSELVYPISRKFIPGTKANVAIAQQQIIDELEKNQLKKMNGKMQALMSYRHLDTAGFRKKKDFDSDNSNLEDLQQIFGDDILFSILKDQETKVSYVFSKKDRV